MERGIVIFLEDFLAIGFFGFASSPFVVEDFRVVAREEPAEFFLVDFCEFFFFIFVSCLFALFDGDTDDLY